MEKKISTEKKRKIFNFLNRKLSVNIEELKEMMSVIKKEELADEDYEWVMDIEKFIKIFNKIR